MKNSPRTAAPRRHAFTIAEVTLALALLALALTMVAEVGVQTLREREHALARQAAEEMATNVLESARACPWENLGPGWAEEQRLPEAYALRGWKWKVLVEPEASRPGVKRVSVTLTGVFGESSPVPPIEMVGLFASRTTKEKP